jgi:hypothetical protein
VPLALLLARTIWTRASADRRDWPFSIAAAGAAGAISVIGLLIARAAPLLRAVDPEWSMFGAGLVIAAGVITLIATVAAPQRYVPGAIAVAATIAVLAMQFAVLSPRRPEPVETFARVIEQYKPMPEVCACGAFARSLVFYTHLKTIVTDTDEEVRTFLSRPERVLAAVEAGTLARVEASLSTTFPRLAEVRYIDSGERQQPATVINPDPRAVKHVILIRNR